MRKQGLLAQYKVIDIIAHGMSGPVYRARQRDSTKFVALKILNHSSTAVRQYFFNEQHLLSRMQQVGGHPHVAELVQSYVQAQPWMVATRFIYSLTPHEVYQQRNPALIAQIADHIASALDYLHTRHPDAPVLHRDVKPQNILVDTTTGNATLIDLSIARSSYSRLSEDHILGTPQYMAPEQHEAAEQPASDQFGLALVAYFYIFGEALLPLNGLDAAAAHEQACTRLSVRFQSYQRLQQVFARALAHDPTQRYESCGDFAAALRVALHQEGIPLHLFPWKPQPVGQRQSTVLLLALLSTALLVLLIIRVWWYQAGIP